MPGTPSCIGKPRTQMKAIEEAAARLREARESGVACVPITDLLEKGDIGGAYAVQDLNTRHRTGACGRIVGRKIGLTNAGIQAALGIDQPDFGMLFADMEVADGGEVRAGSLLQPRAEAELAFVIGRDVTQDQPSMAEIIRAVEFVLPAIEIVDSRIRDWNISLLDTIADNASSGLYVLGGKPTRLSDMDIRLCGMVLELNGEPASTGAGLACMGNPLNAVRWLAGVMAEAGRSLMAGDLVLSGALGPLVPLAPGDHVQTRISGAGSVSVRFGKGEMAQ